MTPRLSSLSQAPTTVEHAPSILNLQHVDRSNPLDCKVKVREYVLVSKPTRWKQKGERVVVESPMLIIPKDAKLVPVKRSCGHEQNSVCYLPPQDFEKDSSKIYENLCVRRGVFEVDAHGVALVDDYDTTAEGSPADVEAQIQLWGHIPTTSQDTLRPLRYLRGDRLWINIDATTNHYHTNVPVINLRTYEAGVIAISRVCWYPILQDPNAVGQLGDLWTLGGDIRKLKQAGVNKFSSWSWIISQPQDGGPPITRTVEIPISSYVVMQDRPLPNAVSLFSKRLEFLTKELSSLSTDDQSHSKSHPTREGKEINVLDPGQRECASKTPTPSTQSSVPPPTPPTSPSLANIPLYGSCSPSEESLLDTSSSMEISTSSTSPETYVSATPVDSTRCDEPFVQYADMPSALWKRIHEHAGYKSRTQSLCDDEVRSSTNHQGHDDKRRKQSHDAQMGTVSNATLGSDTQQDNHNVSFAVDYRIARVKSVATLPAFAQECTAQDESARSERAAEHMLHHAFEQYHNKYDFCHRLELALEDTSTRRLYRKPASIAATKSPTFSQAEVNDLRRDHDRRRAAEPDGLLPSDKNHNALSCSLSDQYCQYSTIHNGKHFHSTRGTCITNTIAPYRSSSMDANSSYMFTNLLPHEHCIYYAEDKFDICILQSKTQGGYHVCCTWDDEELNITQAAIMKAAAARNIMFPVHPSTRYVNREHLVEVPVFKIEDYNLPPD